jgi:hypothetical protein
VVDDADCDEALDGNVRLMTKIDKAEISRMIKRTSAMVVALEVFQDALCHSGPLESIPPLKH